MTPPFTPPPGFNPTRRQLLAARARDIRRKAAAAALRWVKQPVDLALLIGWRDALMLAGAACVVRGVAMWSVPAAWVVAGAGLLVLAVMMVPPAKPGQQ